MPLSERPEKNDRSEKNEPSTHAEPLGMSRIFDDPAHIRHALENLTLHLLLQEKPASASKDVQHSHSDAWSQLVHVLSAWHNTAATTMFGSCWCWTPAIGEHWICADHL
jgi:hypothetical protein